jgi:hypothetical protein
MDSWVYENEGGKHVIFSSTESRYSGRLLRVRRDDLVSAAFPVAPTGDSPFKSSAQTNTSVDFLRRIVYPRLAPYVEVPETIELSPTETRKLARNTMKSGKIPASRQTSWGDQSQLEIDESDAAVGNVVVGTLLFDCKRVREHGEAFFSFEIKPKAGYIAFSPLVDPKHRIKLEQTRFSIQQQLLDRGMVKKGWVSGATKLSEYNPLDLFSGKPAKVEAALQALLLTPQNNLRIWQGDTLVFGHETQSLPGEQMNSLVGALTTMLCEEDVLNKIRAMQLFDVVDADGAVLIYERWVNICDGNLAEADKLLDQIPDEVASNQSGSAYLKASPFPRPQSTVLHQLLLEIERFAQTSASDQQSLDQAYHRTRALVNDLAKPDCIFLLQNWLLSLAMCDVSLMIALSPVDGAMLSETDDWSCKRLQDEKNCGALTCGCNEWVYAIKVVDSDNKPASKLRERGKKEALIGEL